MIGLVHRFNQELEHIEEFTHYRELWDTLQKARVKLKEHKKEAAQDIILQCGAFNAVTNLPVYAKENVSNFINRNHCFKGLDTERRILETKRKQMLGSYQ